MSKPMWKDARADHATKVIMDAAEGYDSLAVAGAAATVLAQACVRMADTLDEAHVAFDLLTHGARTDIARNFAFVKRKQRH